MTTDDIMALADALDDEFTQGRISNHNGRKAAAELRRLNDENEALKAAQYECGFGAGCCYQAAKSEADDVLLRQALDALNHVNVQDRVQIIAALRARVHH